MSEGDKNNITDDEEDINPRKHKQLLQSISRLGKTQHIKEPSRTEHVLKQDEFHLSKTRSISKVKIKDNIVSVDDLVKILNKDKKHLTVGKELKTTQWAKKILPKPLEKPVADRVQRTIGYEKLKSKLKKWDPVVSKNRQSDHQVFPLDYEEIHIDTTIASKHKPMKFSIKSELQLEMEALEEKYRALKGVQKEIIDEKEEERKLQQNLTRKELVSKRKESAYLRMQQSQKSAKDRLHNKIKSKKFHKLLKKDKIKDQLKQFELLQRTDPEAAMEQLEKIEKSRIMERASLRHKNTGTWAKNLQIRAKYDKDVRKDLAEQLAISRELTLKHKPGASDNENESDNNKESDAEINEANNEGDTIDPFNPWVKVGKKKNKNDSDEILTGYKKYWLERNENEKAIQEHKKQLEALKADNEAVGSDEEHVEGDLFSFKKKLLNQQGSTEKINRADLQENEKLKNTSRKSKINNSKNNDNKKNRINIENGWIVEKLVNTCYVGKPFNNGYNSDSNKSSDDEYLEKAKLKLSTRDIDDIFDEAEDKILEKFTKKMKNVKNIMQELESEKSIKNKIKETVEGDELENLKRLSFKNRNQRPDFDEALDEVPMGKTIDNEILMKISNLDKEIKGDETINENTNNRNKTDLIDPNDFANIKPKRLHTFISEKEYFNEEVGDENDINSELSKQMTIAEAFADDDVVVDFTKEKEDRDRQDNEINLTMPGWGSWAGCGINNQNKKRLVLKFPEKEKRRDDNKGNVYINETVNEQLKEHLVSDLPFPFTSVKDYEASIRAPIGRSFVPETAFRVLTKPSVETKMGHIIEPMNESILVKKPFVRKHMIDKKIGKMLKREEKKFSKKAGNFQRK